MEERRILYIREVRTPRHLAGKVDKDRTLPKAQADKLIREGYAIPYDPNDPRTKRVKNKKKAGS